MHFIVKKTAHLIAFCLLIFVAVARRLPFDSQACFAASHVTSLLKYSYTDSEIECHIKLSLKLEVSMKCTTVFYLHGCNYKQDVEYN